MEYLTSSEIAKLGGISSRRVTLLCKKGRVGGTVKKRLIWLIPEKEKKLADSRKRGKE